MNIRSVGGLGLLMAAAVVGMVAAGPLPPGAALTVPLTASSPSSGEAVLAPPLTLQPVSPLPPLLGPRPEPTSPPDQAGTGSGSGDPQSQPASGSNTGAPSQGPGSGPPQSAAPPGSPGAAPALAGGAPPGQMGPPPPGAPPPGQAGPPPAGYPSAGYPRAAQPPPSGTAPSSGQYYWTAAQPSPFGYSYGATLEQAAPAVVGSGTDALIESPDLRRGNAPTLLEKYGAQGYTVDQSSSEGTSNPLGAIADGMFATATWLAQATIAIVQWAFSLELFNFLGRAAASVVGAIEDALYVPFVPVFVILAGLYAIWHGMLRHRGSLAAEGLVWSVAALVLAGVFLARPAAVIDGAEHVSTGLSRTVLAGVSVVDPGQGPDDGTATAATYHGNTADNQLRLTADRFWRVFVYQPWLVFQFGDAAAGRDYGEQLLAARTISREELELVRRDGEGYGELSERKQAEYRALEGQVLGDERVAGWFQGRRSVGRLGVANLALVGVVLGGVLTALIATAVLLAESTFLLLVLIAPIVLLVGIHPGRGRLIAVRWGEVLVGLLLKRIALAALLSVIFVVNGVLLEATYPLGWFVAMGVQVLLVAAVVVYRRAFARLTAPTTLPAINVGNRGDLRRRLQQVEVASRAVWRGRPELLGSTPGAASGPSGRPRAVGADGSGTVQGGGIGTATIAGLEALARGTAWARRRHRRPSDLPSPQEPQRVIGGDEDSPSLEEVSGGGRPPWPGRIGVDQGEGRNGHSSSPVSDNGFGSSEWLAAFTTAALPASSRLARGSSSRHQPTLTNATARLRGDRGQARGNGDHPGDPGANTTVDSRSE